VSIRPPHPARPLLLALCLAAACAAPKPPSDSAPARAPAASAAPTDHATHDHAAHQAEMARAASRDSAFAALQRRGADRRAMGVDQWASTHRFDSLEDGGRIELQRDDADSADVRQIREHLRAIAEAFRAGDFATPAFVHAQDDVPGTRVMAARRARIAYRYADLPRGGEVRLVTRDPEALRAVHEFLAFQRGDHRAGGRTRSP
jgi:hypothetical protein